MKSIIPYSKEIKFKTKINEISSISLEREFELGDFDINGNFIVSGEYKLYEGSLKEKFSYKLPFNVDISNDIIKDSLNLEITDFNYEVNDDTLLINIEFMVSADEIKLEDLIDEEIKEERIEVEEREDVNNDVVLNNVSNEEEFTTYHIHIASSYDTVDAICNSYGIDIDTLAKYNNITDSINSGDKFIIPCLDE